MCMTVCIEISGSDANRIAITRVATDKPVFAWIYIHLHEASLAY